MAFLSIAKGGSETSRELRPAPTPQPSWYADNEWNVSLWHAYAFPGTSNARSTLPDAFLGDDAAFGGGADLKYFFRRYFGIGVEGFGLASSGASTTVLNSGGTFSFVRHDGHLVGGVLGTLTLRYPIGTTRLSPYGWLAGGCLVADGEETTVFLAGTLDSVSREQHSRGIGQLGTGLEIRVTPNLGFTSDFSWNVVDGPNNNFGLVRTGINFSF